MLALYLSLLEDDGERIFLARLYERCWSKLYAVALKLLRDPGSAEDAAQEAMLKIARHLKTAQKIYSKSCLELEYWCVSIVKNISLSMLRKQGRRGELPEEWDAPGPDDVESDAGFRALMGYIHAMPEGYRSVLELRLVSEWSFAEIGKAVGLTEAAAQKRFDRGRRLLREKLIEEGYVEDDRQRI